MRLARNRGPASFDRATHATAQEFSTVGSAAWNSRPSACHAVDVILRYSEGSGSWNADASEYLSMTVAGASVPAASLPPALVPARGSCDAFVALVILCIPAATGGGEEDAKGARKVLAEIEQPVALSTVAETA